MPWSLENILIRKKCPDQKSVIGILIFEKSYHESQKVVVIEKNHALTFQKYSILILKS